MDIFLFVLAILFLTLGFLGTFLPVIPGPPLAAAALIAAFFSNMCSVPIWLVIVCMALAVLVSALDSIFPVLLTKKQQASKWGTWGATIGIFVGLFLGPAGIILGPFLGAFAGETIHNHNDIGRALKIAWGAFLGFLCGTGLKMLAVSIFICIFIYFCTH